MQNTLVIGDIHGCDAELQALLDKAGLSHGDTIIGLGDIVDRGPETPQVLDFFQRSPQAKAIMGNHERKHVRGARHEVTLSISQCISQAQLGEAYSTALQWMAGLPHYIELDEAMVVHGYVEPGMPLELQNPSVLCGTMGGEKILREKYDRPWFELYDARKPVIVGHYNYTNTDQPFVYRDKVYGLDTDCVTGKVLTGILLPSFRFVSVPSRGNLWMQVRRSYQVPKPPPPKPLVIVPWSDEQVQELKFLFEKLQEVNKRLMAQVQEVPGFVDLTSRQQARLYSERIGQGVVPNLLHLTRLGKLDIELFRKIVHDPEQLSQLIDIVMAF